MQNNTEQGTPNIEHRRLLTAKLQNRRTSNPLNHRLEAGFFPDSRVKDPDGALYNLITDPDEKINVYLYPEFQGIIDDLCKLTQDWTAGKNLLIDQVKCA